MEFGFTQAWPWWWWVAIGGVMLLIEVLIPGGFFFLFFGVGALVVGLLTLFWPAMPPAAGLLLFGALSILSLVTFRKRLRELRWFRGPDSRAVDAITGQTALALEPIEPGNQGRIELRGSPWSARNTSSVLIQAGSRCVVTKAEGVILEVTPE